MIFWRGYGILVGLFGFAGLVIAELLTRQLTKDESYYQAHSLPRLAGAVLAAILAYGCVKLLERNDKPRIVVDKATGQELQLRRGDTLFFIPVKYWPYIFFGIGAIVAFVPAS